MKRQTKWISLVSLILLFALAVFSLYGIRNESHRRFVRLLNGAEDVRIQSITIEGQRRVIKITDEESLRFLEAAMRKSIRDGKKTLGLSYHAHFSLGWPHSKNVGLYAGEKNDGITIGFHEENPLEWSYYTIELPEPLPQSLADVLDKMRH